MALQTRYIIGTSSAAYDLKRFETKPRVRVRKPALVVKRPSEQARAKAKVMYAVKVVAALSLVALVVVTMLYSRAVLTELDLQISQANANLTEMKSEQTRLAAELESKVSLRNVEEYASQKLGMSTMDKQQITYVDLSEGDKIELTQQSPKKTLLDQIRLAIAKVKEYIPQE
jgi:cell division protein FtsB